MKSQIAIYNTHDKAIRAIKVLDENHFPMDHVSLLGSADILEDHIRFKSFDFAKKAPALIAMGIGTILGALSGLGLSIPGLSFLYEAGMVVGAVGGLGIGLVVGFLISFVVFVSVKEDKVFKSEEHFKEGKFRIILNGPKEEIEKAEYILHTEKDHLELAD